MIYVSYMVHNAVITIGQQYTINDIGILTVLMHDIRY